MSYMKAKEAIDEAARLATKVNVHRMDVALLEYIKEVEDRLQSTLEVNHLWDGS